MAIDSVQMREVWIRIQTAVRREMDLLWYGDEYGFVDKQVYTVVRGGDGRGDVMLVYILWCEVVMGVVM